MNKREKQALGALAAMVDQYLATDPNGRVDSGAVSGGEYAISALAAYGYMDEIVEGCILGKWTEAGEALLKWAHPWSEQKDKPFPEPPISAE